MIDFRYHLISIIAVFLALGIGILMGSLVLGENLVDQLERELHAIETRNNELQESIEALNAQVEVGERFAQAARPRLLGSELQGERIILFTFQDMDGDTLEQVRSAVEDAGGSIGGFVEATSKLALDNQPTRDELALLIGSSATQPGQLRTELGRMIAIEAAQTSTGQGQDDQEPPGIQPGDGRPPLDALLRDLQDADFVNFEVEGGSELVAPASDFVVVGGGVDAPPFPVADYTRSLSASLGQRSAPIVVAEGSSSTWELVGTIRADGIASDVVTTVDQAETNSGSIAVVLGLEGSEDGVVGHYGIGPGAQAILPEPFQP